MPRILTGPRIGRQGVLRICCVAAILDEVGRLLLTRRRDDGFWCFPGGAMEAGESVKEACAREVVEETGLQVRIGKLRGIYSSPDYICEYEDGNRWHTVEVLFEAHIIGSALGISDETTDARFFRREDIDALSMHQPDRDRLADAFSESDEVSVR